ncbi:dockerin type I domain-containing protein [Acutalibacter caecimuris]|uniref:dockerin type I domain-containing protein n=1 Tax=Acutalibacter caecimuris TaxID=3093657 RepID=UPI002AC95AD6|nr:dockerin type I domain-containing protein [Acutalibacter sp. M00118]
MKTNSHHNQRRHFHRWKMILFLMVAVPLFSLLAFSSGDGVEQYYITSSDNREILAFGQGDDGVYLMLREEEGIYAYCISPENGGIEELDVTEIQPQSGFICSGALGMLGDVDGIPTLLLWRPGEDLEAVKSNGLSFYAFDIPDDAFRTVLADGPFYLANIGGDVEVYAKDAFDPEYVGLSGVTFLSSTPNGRVYAYADGTLYRWEGNAYNEREEYPCPVPPEGILGEDGFLDQNGIIKVIENGEVTTAVTGIEQLALELCFVHGSEIYTATAADTVCRYNLLGEITGTFLPDGYVRGLTTAWALIEKDGAFFLSPYIFTTEDDSAEETPEPTSEPTPIPTVEPSEEPTPLPSEDPSPIPSPSVMPDETDPKPKPFYKEIEVDEITYVLLEEDTTVRQLRELKKPEAVLIMGSSGIPLAEGKLKTGMKMNDAIIVIIGDCNGDGYVSRADMIMMEDYVLGKDGFAKEEAFLAVDLDYDEEITLLDLVAMAKMLGKRGRG